MDPETNLLPPPVLLCWTDADTGEDLCILVHGPPEFLEELRSEGLAPTRAYDERGRELPAPRVTVASA